MLSAPEGIHVGQRREDRTRIIPAKEFALDLAVFRQRNGVATSIDHDRLFKELLTTFFAEFVELFLPEMATYLDAGSIQFLDKEVFTDVTAGERHEADVVARVRSRGTESCFLECLRLLTSLRLDPARLKLISGFIDTYLRLSREETLQFEHEANMMLTVDERSKMLELTTSWKEEGRQEGLQEGLQTGRREECARVVLRLMQRRLGPLDSAMETRIRDLPLDRLEALAEALLDFTSVSDLTDWLASNSK